MCIIAVSHNNSDRFPLMVAANRDERHARASAPADWWTGDIRLLGGRDLEAGGTWLGVTKEGRFAAVTNIFEGTGPRAERSRGMLVTDFLEGASSASEHADTVNLELYSPFNLILLDGAELQLVSNRNRSTPLDAGIHVFSNNAPGHSWPKVGSLGGAMSAAAADDDPTERLLASLTGEEVRGSLDQAADSAFVVGENFGTRCSTVLTVDTAGRARFVEQRFDSGGGDAGRSEFEFDILR